MNIKTLPALSHDHEVTIYPTATGYGTEILLGRCWALHIEPSHVQVTFDGVYADRYVTLTVEADGDSWTVAEATGLDDQDIPIILSAAPNCLIPMLDTYQAE